MAIMKLTGPDRYRLTFDSQQFTVLCPNGTDKFSGLATCRKPKLYIVSIEERRPIYVGITKQPMRNRLRLGWNATGDAGYYGYSWRHKIQSADLDIWCVDDAQTKSMLDIETIESEVVFLIRSAGQWPEFQTEIHFHASTVVHRAIAAEIAANYNLVLSSTLASPSPQQSAVLDTNRNASKMQMLAVDGEK
jgi:hypothetical protein